VGGTCGSALNVSLRLQLPGMHYLIIKHSALGDVVRTSYFAEALRRSLGNDLRLSWITSSPAMPLLRFNPHINDLWADFVEAAQFEFDRIFSLDDEIEVVRSAAALRTKSITGAVLDNEGNRTYTPDAAIWFDMGLLSRYGKRRADQLKKENRLTHAQIFSQIFEVRDVRPSFWGEPRLQAEARNLRGETQVLVGLNPYAGDRWKSKELPAAEQSALVKLLLNTASPPGRHVKLLLLGAGLERNRNVQLAAKLSDERIVVANTEDSVLRLAAVVRTLDYLITSDSLALHLAIAQSVPFLAFFAPTSAAEIDDFGLGVKLTSASPDYCSYLRDADNTTITATRIMEMAINHKPEIFLARSIKDEPVISTVAVEGPSLP